MQFHEKAPQGGFTLVEIIVALTVFAIISLSVTTTLLSNASVNRRLDDQSVAVRIAEQTLERYRQKRNYSGLSSSEPVTEEVTMNGRTFDTTTTFCSATRGADLIAKMPCSADAVFLEVEVKRNEVSLSKVATYYTKFGASDDAAE